MAELGSYMTYHNSQFLALYVGLKGGTIGLATKVTSMELCDFERTVQILARRGACMNITEE